MSEYKKISRASLYDSESDYESENESNPTGYLPNLQFEFVEVDDSKGFLGNGAEVDTTTHEVDKINDNDNDEFEFPLFTAPINKSDTTQEQKDEEERGRSRSVAMKVSLREESVEVIKNERPISYYIATYTDKEKAQFLAAAIMAEDIYNDLYSVQPVDPKPWKCLNLNEYNAKIEEQLEKQRTRSQKLKRPGKKKRSNKIACRERKIQRKKLEKKIEKEKQAMLLKKIFRKRGGKKHKKSNSNKPASKPKYRTE